MQTANTLNLPITTNTFEPYSEITKLTHLVNVSILAIKIHLCYTAAWHHSHTYTQINEIYGILAKKLLTTKTP